MTREIQEILEAARAAGAVEAEVFSKTGRGRKVVLEPALRPGAPPIQTVSDSEEEGLALRVMDREGRRGFAWIGLPALQRSRASLLESALASARRDAAGAGSTCAPLGPGPRRIDERPELRLADPECMTLPVERIAKLLLEAADENAGSGAFAVDRLSLSEAVTTITLANSRGFCGSYTKSLVFLGVAIIPAEPGAAAVIEERSACRLSDLDPRECIREASLRAGPARQPVDLSGGRTVPLVLTPRASASFLAAILPWTFSGESGVWKGCSLRIVDDPTLPGRPGTAPFDGAGYVTRRHALVEGWAWVGRLSPDGGRLVRPSYRDLPEVGPAGIVVLPSDGPSAGVVESRDEGDGLMLLISALEVSPGPVWRLRIRRGEWWSGGSPRGPADGLAWEGPLPVLLRGVSVAGDEVKFYHCGAPLGTPGMRFDGIAPLRVAPRSAAGI